MNAGLEGGPTRLGDLVGRSRIPYSLNKRYPAPPQPRLPERPQRWNASALIVQALTAKLATVLAVLAKQRTLVSGTLTSNLATVSQWARAGFSFCARGRTGSCNLGPSGTVGVVATRAAVLTLSVEEVDLAGELMPIGCCWLEKWFGDYVNLWE